MLSIIHGLQTIFFVLALADLLLSCLLEESGDRDGGVGRGALVPYLQLGDSTGLPCFDGVCWNYLVWS